MGFQLLVCDVAVGGDIRNVVHRGVDSPVTYPETLILEFVHGPSTVTDVRDMGEIERSQDDEMLRLKKIYGPDLVNQLFPGALAQLPMRTPNVTSFDAQPVGIVKNAASKKLAKKTALQQAERASGKLKPALEGLLDTTETEDEEEETPAPAPAKPTKAKTPSDTASLDTNVGF